MASRPTTGRKSNFINLQFITKCYCNGFHDCEKVFAVSFTFSSLISNKSIFILILNKPEKNPGKTFWHLIMPNVHYNMFIIFKSVSWTNIRWAVNIDYLNWSQLSLKSIYVRKKYKKHDSSKTTWKSSLIFEFICKIQSSTNFKIYNSWIINHKVLLVLGFSKYGLHSFLLSLDILRILFRFQFCQIQQKLSKSERSSSYLRKYWKHKKGRPHFGNLRTNDRFMNLCLDINEDAA